MPRGANRLAPLLPGADVLWALEQSLKSGHVGAVLAWLPVNLRADALRRLQLAAQAHDGPVFLFRDALACGTMECYFPLAAQFTTQADPAFCGLGTLAMVLNALNIDPGRVWKGPWRWYQAARRRRRLASHRAAA